MVTTRITEAVPITMPERGEQGADGIGAKRLRAELERFAEEHGPGLAALHLLEELLGFGARRIVGRQRTIQVALEQFSRNIQIALVLM